MLRVLTLSSLFPNAAQPTFGIFVERQTLGLAALPDVEVQVVAPIGLPPWPLRLHPHYRDRAGLPRIEAWKGLAVHRPRFTVLPGLIGPEHNARSMARALLPMLRRLRESFAFDVIDAEFFWPDGPAATRLSRALGVPFSIKARGSDIQYWGDNPAVAGQMREAAEAASGLLSVSEALNRRMIALGMPGEKITVHYTGVDLDRFALQDRVAAKARLGVEGPLVVSVGALIARKGQRLAIQAMRSLPDTTLLLVGDGPDRPQLESLAGDFGGRVRFLGNRPHEELPGLFAAADVMMLPSESEGLANVWVEALACGTPIVISDAGGARELLGGSKAGRIVTREPEAIAAAVRSFLAEPPDPGSVRAVAERFRWDRNAAELSAHLRRITASAPPRSSAPLL